MKTRAARQALLLGAQTLATPRPASLHHPTTAFGGHSGAETVTTLAHKLARLVRPFHESLSAVRGMSPMNGKPRGPCKTLDGSCGAYKGDGPLSSMRWSGFGWPAGVCRVFTLLNGRVLLPPHSLGKTPVGRGREGAWLGPKVLPMKAEVYSYPRSAGTTIPVWQAPVAQLDRAPDYESGGQEFESLRARQLRLRPRELRVIFVPTPDI